ncbi:MAG: hypothetical protein U9N11_01720 [Campylobacterota bacterium]|nr:hypothetical protein [Campylobacterota bacterium]
MNKIGMITLSVALASELAFAGGQILAKADTNVAVIDDVKADIVAPVYTKAKYKYVKKPITADDGAVHGYVRMHHIFDGNENGFDPVTGSTLGFGLGYGMELIKGLKVGAEIYGVMDSGLTDTDETAIAYGQFLNEVKSPSELDAGTAWGAHISYASHGVKATLARSQFKSPFTKIQITHVPNLYEFARLDGKILGGKATLAYITKMSYGSRSAADFGLIGEVTGTAGMAISPFKNPKGYLERGTYFDISDTVKSNDSSGILVLGYEKKIKRFNFRVWDFMVDDVANNLYADASYKIPLGKGKGMKLSAQVWNQNIDNAFYEKNYGGTMVGAEAVVKWGKVIGKFAYTSKDEGGLLNAWGSNPGYTSSIFSRNEYRGDVNAYKATLVYKPLKNLKFMVSYADYGQSDMNLNGKKPDGTKFSRPSQTDATERDIAIVYKPLPQLTLKLFNANRTSEYSIAKKKRTQNHTRLIMNYAF